MNFNGTPNPNGRNIAMASLRAVVACYIIYLGGKIISDHVKGESEMAPWMCWFFGILFIVAGAAFLFYTWKRYKKDKAEEAAKAAEEAAAAAVSEETAEESAETPTAELVEKTAEESVSEMVEESVSETVEESAEAVEEIPEEAQEAEEEKL